MGPLHASVRSTVLVNAGADQVPTAARIEQTFAGLASVAAADTVAVYIAGLGEFGGDGRYYFLPTDATRDATQPATQNAIEWSRIQSQLSRAPGRRFLFVDMSKPGGAFNARIGVDARAELLNVFVSTGVDQISLESPALGHGLFAYALAEGLSGKALAQSDRGISLFDLGTYVSRDVRQRSQGRQTPEFYAGGGNAVLVRN
jgi:uncharacterized caspase-like protein